MTDMAAVATVVVGVAAIVWGAEAFAEHLAPAAVALRVSTFALALLLAGAEPEELAILLASYPAFVAVALLVRRPHQRHRKSAEHPPFPAVPGPPSGDQLTSAPLSIVAT